MKLVYISSARIPSEKANTYQVMQMCDAFMEYGLDVTLLYPERENTPEMRFVQNVDEYYGIKHPFKQVKLPAIDLLWKATHYIPDRFPLRQSFHGRLFRLLIASYGRSVISYLRLHSAEFFYTRSLEIAPSIARLPAEITRRLFIEVHAIPDDPVEKSSLERAMHASAGVLTITHQLKERVEALGIPATKILVAPDGVDLERFQQQEERTTARVNVGLPKEAFIAGYVGRLHTLSQEKGVADLIRAAAYLKGVLPVPLVLCFVGGPDELARQYQELGDSLGLGKVDIRFVEQQPPGHIPDYLWAFNVCVMPFPWTEHYAFYMSPLKLFEYMASRRPILATSLPSVEEILEQGRNGYLVPPGDPQALAAGLRWLAEHPQEAQALADQAWQDVQEYTWKKRAGKIVEFMRSRAGLLDTQEKQAYG